MSSIRSLGRRVWRRIGYLRAARSIGGLLTDGRYLAQVSGRWRPVEPAVGMSAFDVLRSNLDLVVGCLEAAGIDHFVVTWPQDDRPSVGVSDADRIRVRDALVQGLRDSTATVQWGDADADTALVSQDGIPDAALDAERWRVYRVFGVEHSSLAFAAAYSCDLDFWHQAGAELTAPVLNRMAETLDLTAAQPTVVERDGREYHTFQWFVSEPRFDAIDFPIDAVYTWVDGEDPQWRAKRARFSEEAPENPEAANAARYQSREDLRFSLRSLTTYAPWVRHVYLVTDDQVPSWLRTDHPGLTVVDHRDIFRDPSNLPTFNSHAIESQLHHIDGLADHYLYLNDDVYFGRLVRPNTFFHGNGIAQHFLSRHQFAFGAPSADEPPVSAAGKNVRELIADEFGRMVTQKVKHVPHPQIRAVLEELETRHGDVFTNTAAARFRSPTDYSIASVMHHYYAYLTGRSVPGRIRYQYVDSSSPDLRDRLKRLTSGRSYDVFCINDTTADAQDIARITPILRRFLEDYFPAPSPFEKA